jgi:hypothetical protein
MSNILSHLWNEEEGAIVSAEIVLVASILVIGVLSGLVSVRDSVVTELADVGQAIANIDQSFSFGGVVGHHVFTGGGVFFNTPGFCDGPFVVNVINSKCIVICTVGAHPLGGGIADGGFFNNGGGF